MTREQVHELVDQLDPGKLDAVGHLLEVMTDEDELTAADRTAIQAGLDSIAKNGTVSMEEVLSDFGLTLAEFERMAAEPDRAGYDSSRND